MDPRIFVPLYDNSVQILNIEEYVRNGFTVSYVYALFDKNYQKLKGFVVCLH